MYLRSSLTTLLHIEKREKRRDGKRRRGEMGRGEEGRWEEEKRDEETREETIHSTRNTSIRFDLNTTSPVQCSAIQCSSTDVMIVPDSHAIHHRSQWLHSPLITATEQNHSEYFEINYILHSSIIADSTKYHVCKYCSRVTTATQIDWLFALLFWNDRHIYLVLLWWLQKLDNYEE